MTHRTQTTKNARRFLLSRDVEIYAPPLGKGRFSQDIGQFLSVEHCNTINPSESSTSPSCDYFSLSTDLFSEYYFHFLFFFLNLLLFISFDIVENNKTDYRLKTPYFFFVSEKNIEFTRDRNKENAKSESKQLEKSLKYKKKKNQNKAVKCFID